MHTNQGNILIVDDSRELLEAMQIFLEYKNYTISCAASEFELDALFENAIPDLIILDVMLKIGLDGREICKLLKANFKTKNIPIILMSGNPEELLEFKKCNADAILHKPFDLTCLIKKIENFIPSISIPFN